MRQITVLSHSFSIADPFQPGHVLTAEEAEAFNAWNAQATKERLRFVVYDYENGRVGSDVFEARTKKILSEPARTAPPRGAKSAEMLCQELAKQVLASFEDQGLSNES